MADVEPTVEEFIASIDDDTKRADTNQLVDLISSSTSLQPRMWGRDTIGFGEYHYKYGSGQEGNFFTVGIAPRKQNLTLYIMSGLRGFEDILERLGPHKASKSCVYLNRVGDIDRDTLIELITECVAHVDLVERQMGAVPRMSEIPPRIPE